MVFIFLTLLLTPLSSFASSSRYSILPTRHLNIEENGHRFSHPNPCGQSFEGVLFGLTEGTVGAVFKSSKIKCAGLSKFAIHKVRGLKMSPKALTWIGAIQWWEKPKILPLISVSNGRDGDLVVTYQTKCGRPLGVLAKPIAKGIQLSMVEAVTSKTNQCRPKVIEQKLHWLRIEDHKVVTLNKLQPPKSIERRFYLLSRSAKIRNRRKSGEIKVTYKRKCNEAPIGYSLRIRKKELKIEVGMVVARYFNFKCPTNSPRLFTSHYSISTIPNSTNISGSTPSKSQVVSLNPLLSIEKKGREVFYNFPQMCDRKNKTLVFLESEAQLRVAMVEKEQKCQVKKTQQIRLPQQIGMRFQGKIPLLTTTPENGY